MHAGQWFTSTCTFSDPHRIWLCLTPGTHAKYLHRIWLCLTPGTHAKYLLLASDSRDIFATLAYKNCGFVFQTIKTFDLQYPPPVTLVLGKVPNTYIG